MKFKRGIMFLSIVISIVLLTSFSFASSNNNSNELLSKNSLEKAAEKDEILNALKGSLDQIETHYKDKSMLDPKTIKNLDKIKDPKELPEIKIDKVKSNEGNSAYKVYLMKTVDFVTDFENTGSFQKLISNEYFWESPIFDELGNVVSVATFAKGKKFEEYNLAEGSVEKEVEDAVRAREGKWFMESNGNFIPNESVEFIVNKDAISNVIIKAGIDIPTDLKVVSLPGFYTYMLYMKDDKNEFGIPFTYREDLTGLVNGNIYKVSELVNNLKNSYAFIHRKDFAEGTYGAASLTSSEYTAKSNTIYIILSIAIIACILLVTALVVIRRRKPQITQS
jgi:hypothetical protein